MQRAILENLKIVSKNLWQTKPVFLVGGGRSLEGFDFNRLKGKGHVIAINDAMLHLPWADAVFSADKIWIKNREKELKRFFGLKFFAIQKESIPEWMDDCCVLNRARERGLSEQSDTVRLGGNSGYAALNLAYLGGAKTIVLMGYDLNRPAHVDGIKTKAHWHKGYPWFKTSDFKRYATWADNFKFTLLQLYRNDIKIFNTNPNSAIKAFPFVELEKVLD